MRTIEAIAREIQEKMPSEFVERAEALRVNEDKCRWESGDMSMELVDEWGENYPKTAIRMALAWTFGVSEGTIRDRERVSRAVDAPRRASHPLISHRMWRIAIAATEPGNVIAQIEGYYDAYTRLPSIDQVLGWRNEDGFSPVFLWQMRASRLKSYADKIIYDDQAPEDLKGLAKWMVYKLDRLST